MPRSHVKQLLEGFGNLAKLRLLDLSDSKDFVQTPNFNGLPILEVLIFQGCTSLYELHLPVGALNRLTLLNLKDCKNLESLPSKINLESLKFFILSGCSTLKKFPDIGKNMTHLLELYLDGTAIEELPPSIEHFTGLSLLSLKDCKRLTRFPRVNLPSLKTLILSGCKFQPPKSWLSHGLSFINAPHVSNDFFPTQSRLSHGLPVILAPHVSNDFFPTQSRLSHGLPVIRALHVSNDFRPTLGPFNQLLPRLSGLVSLDLSDCSLLDGALPDDLTCLSSLQFLNLRKNNFTCLPDSISQLSKLVDLNLNDCSKLQSLPNLPLSIGYVTARRCTSLANYSNQQFWTSGERGVALVDCRSDKQETRFNLDVASSESYGLASNFEKIYSEWFSHRSPAGSSVKIPLSSNLCDNNSWSGIAFFAISVPPKNLKEDIFHGKELLLSIKTTCHSDMVGGLENCPQYIYPLKMSNVYRNIPFGYGSYIPAKEIIDYLDEYSFITVSITSNHPHLDFKCGARKVHVDDLTEFEHVIKNSPLGSSTEDHSVVSCQRYSTQRLESLLLGLYQGDWAKNHKYDYIIPYITVPAWFSNHRFCSNIRIRLPEILNFDERWLGIAVCAYYTVDKQLAGYDDHKDLTSFLCFYNLLPNHQIRLTRHKVFQDSEDIFVDSTHRILVYYISQMLFRLRGCSHIGASFEPKNPGVQVKECGIEHLFEQNVEEFVQTLVQCMLGCPDAYHEYFYHNLLSHQYERESCFDNGKDNGCSSSSQRMRQPMPNIAEHCTSPAESFSNPQIDVGRQEILVSLLLVFSYQLGKRNMEALCPVNLLSKHVYRKIAKMGKFSTAILLSVKSHSGFAIKLMGMQWH
nr:tmv resistance protein n [Quercus suber]